MTYALYLHIGETVTEAMAREAVQGHRKQYNDLAHQPYEFEPLPPLTPEEEAALRRWCFFGGPLPDSMKQEHQSAP